MFQGARSARAMTLTELLISGANASVVVFVVSSTLSVGLALTVPQILAPLRNVRLVVLSLLANFVLAPIVAIGLPECSGWMNHLGSDCCWLVSLAVRPFYSSSPISRRRTCHSRSA